MTQHSELKRIDQEIENLERLIAIKQEYRREIINRMGRNKGGAVGVGNSYVFGEAGTDTLMPNKCEHKKRTCVDVTAMSGDKTKLACHCDDCGLQLLLQHECKDC